MNNNDWADFWRGAGFNAYPMNDKIPNLAEYKHLLGKPTPIELHNFWKRKDYFKNGVGIENGRLYNHEHRQHVFAHTIDCDNEAAIKLITNIGGVQYTLEEIAKRGVIVEQHDDITRCHIILFSEQEFPNLAPITGKDDSFPKLEVKGSGKLTTVTPTKHKNGSCRQLIGDSLKAFEECVIHTEFMHHIDNALKPFGINYLAGKNNVKTFSIKKDAKWSEGARNDHLYRHACSTLRRLYDTTPPDIIKKMVLELNLKNCVPPLDDKEVNQIWDSALKFISEQIELELEQEGPNNTNTNTNKKTGVGEKYQELEGNVYYKINGNPRKYIVAHKQNCRVIEVEEKSYDDTINGIKVKKYYLRHNRTYLGCIPFRIVRHKSPLTFLESSVKYTVSFVDSIGERHTFKHKTLAEIVQSLKELSYVLNDGSDMALAAMVQAFRENKLIEYNEDIEWMGFFVDKENNKILASNIEIIKLDIEKVADAINFLLELKTHYENRLDLLATSIVWGMVAPAIFMLKTNNYFLKALHFYGFPNATKSNTGKIILALDGHHEDQRFALNFSRVDSIPRLGEAVSRSTFPILVDEANLSDEKMGWIINALKSIIESIIARTKFPNGVRMDIPSLSCLILTSNPPPPFHDSGYMRRIIARNFSQSEMWKENDPKALEFKEFLRVNLPRLKALGDFRNSYIMSHQDEILDEKRPNPLDLGLNILRAAFQYIGQDIPGWLVSERLPENQLEESMQDNDIIVKRAFEKYIDEQVNRNLQILKLDDTFVLKPDISDRLVKLAESKLLPDMRYIAINREVIIYKGLLTELYNHGVGRDQCPNLKALADYMKADYRTIRGKKVVAVSIAQLTAYFDKVDE